MAAYEDVLPEVGLLLAPGDELEAAAPVDYPPLFEMYELRCGQLETGLQGGTPAAAVCVGTRRELKAELHGNLQRKTIAYARILLLQIFTLCYPSSTDAEQTQLANIILNKRDFAVRLRPLIRLLRRTMNAIVNKHYSHNSDSQSDRASMEPWIRNNIEPELRDPNMSKRIPNILIAWLFASHGCRRCAQHDAVTTTEVPGQWIHPANRRADTLQYNRDRKGSHQPFGASRQGLPPAYFSDTHRHPMRMASEFYASDPVSFRLWMLRDRNMEYFDGRMLDEHPLETAFGLTLAELEQHARRPVTEAEVNPVQGEQEREEPVPEPESFWRRYILNPVLSSPRQVRDLFSALWKKVSGASANPGALDPDLRRQLKQMTLARILSAKLTVQDPQRPGLFYSWSNEKHYSVKMMAQMVMTVLPEAVALLRKRIEWLKKQREDEAVSIFSFTTVSTPAHFRQTLRHWFPDLVSFDAWYYEVSSTEEPVEMEVAGETEEEVAGPAPQGVRQTGTQMNYLDRENQLDDDLNFPKTRSMDYAHGLLKTALDGMIAGSRRPLVGVAMRDEETGIISSKLIFKDQDVRNDLLERCSILLVHYMLQRELLVPLADVTINEALGNDISDEDSNTTDLEDWSESRWLQSRAQLWK
jgi:hypothetical protein